MTVIRTNSFREEGDKPYCDQQPMQAVSDDLEEASKSVPQDPEVVHVGLVAKKNLQTWLRVINRE